ncbi:hypothetical protein JTE90_000321 [Oedothorax gibbosus]|uniref:Saccharopine dehydrogenase NADP binding domain-containing protein n=1 Tax=Oedothorax gibbosus TaxID=931172 RepID=A0AAV6VRX8_9ARAC|nr:hypothetical protein JTE90_000321 [Oedothorax gibbosus]
MASRDFDIIIFGGTGYTGQYVIEELANSSKQTGIKWAIAGRNIQKLKEALNTVQKYIGNSSDISGTTVIQADVKDEASILDMCKQGKLVLNCVGPYNLYGEIVVRACIEAGTHLVDISAEIKYSETMQAKYFMQAREKGVYIVEACGFGSVPADYGISLLKNEFAGDLNAVEYYFEIGVGSEGRKTNYGTYTSIIHSIKDQLFSVGKYKEALKKEVFKKDLAKSCFPLHKRCILSYNNEVNGWCLWYLGPDERVIHRSQQFRYEYLNERTVQCNGYFQLPSFFISLGYLFFAAVVALMSFFSCGLHILKKYPSFFTAGEISLTGPTRKQVMEGTTKFTLYGTGWSNKLEEPTDQHTTQPDKKMKLTINGPEAGYVLTSMCMVQCGLTMLEEQNKLPLEGGVLTPGVTFQNTSLRQRLEKRGMIFEFETIE